MGGRELVLTDNVVHFHWDDIISGESLIICRERVVPYVRIEHPKVT